MSLKTAQELIVMDPMQHDHSDLELKLVPLEIEDSFTVEEPHCEHLHITDSEQDTEVFDDPVEFEIIDIPGAPPGTKHPEPELEISEEEDVDEARDKESKKGKWDWSSYGTEGFFDWVKERIDNCPKHSGMEETGIERCLSYFDRLDSEISKAMRADLDGELDADKIEKARASIENGIELLEDRLDAIKSSKKKSKKKKAELVQEGFQKEAQKITGVKGIYVTVPLLISRIARVCINGTVSAGHDLTDLFHRQVEFYDLNKREQAEVVQLLEDMGYVIREDRGMFDQDVDIRSSDNMDWSAFYHG